MACFCLRQIQQLCKVVPAARHQRQANYFPVRKRKFHTFTPDLCKSLPKCHAQGGRQFEEAERTKGGFEPVTTERTRAPQAESSLGCGCTVSCYRPVEQAPLLLLLLHLHCFRPSSHTQPAYFLPCFFFFFFPFNVQEEMTS